MLKKVLIVPCVIFFRGISWATKDKIQRANYFGSLTQASSIRVGSYNGEEIHAPFKSLLPMVLTFSILYSLIRLCDDSILHFSIATSEMDEFPNLNSRASDLVVVLWYMHLHLDCFVVIGLMYMVG